MPHPIQHRRKSLAVDVRIERRGVPRNVASYLRREVARLALLAGVAEGELSIFVVGDRRMAALHLEHTGVAGATDVLTFDLAPATHPARRIDADLVLCWDVARREADRLKHSPREELLLYALHGVLHLVGYDDHSATDARAMHRREDAILAKAGHKRLYRGE